MNIEQIKSYKRREIRYALFRCKAGTPDENQLEIFNTYQSQLEEFGFGIEDFTTEWDVDKNDFTQIVTGKIARKYNQDRSLFANDGTLKV